MKREAERKRLFILENYRMQNNWLKWNLTEMMRKDLTWNKILTGYSAKLLKFVLNANLLTLATPDNLKRWNIFSDASCGLCAKPNVTLSHVLAGCPWVLKVENKFNREDRNTWRHNCVLLHLANNIRSKLQDVNSMPVTTDFHTINFIPAGQRPVLTSSKPKHHGWLSEARDWQCDFDLPEFRQSGSKYRLPVDITLTEVRSDGCIVSYSRKICIG